MLFLLDLNPLTSERFEQRPSVKIELILERDGSVLPLLRIVDLNRRNESKGTLRSHLEFILTL